MIQFTKMFTKEKALKYAKFWDRMSTLIWSVLAFIGVLIIVGMVIYHIAWNNGYNRGFESGMIIQEGISERLCNERIEKGLVQ